MLTVIFSQFQDVFHIRNTGMAFFHKQFSFFYFGYYSTFSGICIDPKKTLPKKRLFGEALIKSARADAERF